MTTQPIETVDLQEVEPRPLLTYEHVRAQWMRSTVTAASAAALAAIICWRMGVTLEWAGFWTAITAAAYMALRMVVHDMADDSRTAWRARTWKVAMADLQEQSDDDSDTIAGLRWELAKYKRENSQLEARLQALTATKTFVTATDAPSDPTVQDAQVLVERWFAAGVHPSRRHMKRYYGWSDDRHIAAMNLLQQRGCVTVGAGNKPTWEDSSLAAALSRLLVG